MRTLLLAPHADDESLFASYLAQRYGAHIAVVFDEGREDELSMATAWLGCAYSQLGARKGMDEEAVETFLWGLHDPVEPLYWDRVIAPAEQVQGHEEHNIVACLAPSVFPDAELIQYLTYAPRGKRSVGTLSSPERPEFIARKLAALSCYRTQIEEPSTRPWFYELLDMREFVA